MLGEELMRSLWLSGIALLLLLAPALSLAHGEEARSAVVLTQEQKAAWADIAGKLGDDRSFALVIGISDFERLPHLRGVQPEAILIANTLAKHGFNIERAGTDGTLTKADLKERIEKFLRAHGDKAENRLIIYIATHGYAAEERREYGFLAASDTLRPGAEGFEASAFSVGELSAALTGLAAQHVYLFFNACFSGAMVPDPVRGDEELGAAAKRARELSPEVERWTLDLLSHNARLVLTAGSDGQTVPDANNPFSRAIADALAGDADADGDGLVLGTELAQFVRGRVARETRVKGKANDAVFAILPKLVAPSEPRPDAPSRIDYALQGDYVFLSPKGPRDLAVEGRDELAEILAAKAKRLPGGQFVECADCPVMVEVPGNRIAIGRTEVTYAEWDACYREFGCRRLLADDGNGRGDRPAAGMTWQDALEFSLWLDGKKGDRCKSYRLMSKDEWLAAARSGEDEVGDIAEEGHAACDGCGAGRDDGRALPVASLAGNSLGMHDLAGNLWEWVDDGSECGFAELRKKGACEAEGTVMGGSYATSAAALSHSLEGHMPRTSNEWPWSWATVGLRVACEVVK